jgi:hypothetical protein
MNIDEMEDEKGFTACLFHILMVIVEKIYACLTRLKRYILQLILKICLIHMVFVWQFNDNSCMKQFASVEKVSNC